MDSASLQGRSQGLDHVRRRYHAPGGFARPMTYKEGMGILDRISRLVSSNVNAAIDKMSDPGKEIDQLVIEMETQLKNARKEVQTALAQEKRQRTRAEALAKSSREWEERAERAVRAGDDNLAKEALTRKAQIDAEGQEATHGLEEATSYAEKLTASLKQLDARITEVKLRKETLKAKARASKGVNSIGSPALDAFDRLHAKVDAVDAEAELDQELAALRHEDAKSIEVERKLEEMSKNKDLDDRLAALKAQMAKKADEKKDE
jgi:phage shock protein A